jgi:hypothetical protein
MNIQVMAPPLGSCMTRENMRAEMSAPTSAVPKASSSYDGSCPNISPASASCIISTLDPSTPADTLAVQQFQMR